MRVMAKITMPTDTSNKAIQDGSIGNLMQETAGRWHPEAMYFTTFDGRRTAFMIFDMQDSSDMPPFAEPFFQGLGALVEMSPVMNGDDLQKGLSQLG
jgi:hypothetical protein